MAESNRDCRGLVLLALLLVAVRPAAGAQVPSASAAAGSLSGRLTDLHSAPLRGAAVMVRNDATGQETPVVTLKNGIFRLDGLQPGSYTVVAEVAKLGRGQLSGVVVSAGHEARVQAAMAFEPDSPPLTAAIASPETTTESARAAAASPHSPPLPEPARSSPPAADPLLAIKTIEQRAEESAKEKLAAEAPVVVASLVSEPLLILKLDGLPAPEPPSAVARNAGRLDEVASLSDLATNEVAAVGAIRAAVESMHLLTQAASVPTAQLRSANSPDQTVLTGTEIHALPAAGRRWQDFVLDSPAGANAASGAQADPQRGGAMGPMQTRLDGANTRMAFGGSGSSGEDSANAGGATRAWSAGRGSPVAEAAIHEVQTAAADTQADGMRTAGGRLNIETQRGSNGLHGQAFAFDRQNTWGAQNPFTQWVKQTAPATLTSTPQFTAEPYTPPDHESVWGLGLGSQIKRDKLFWFGALDSYRRNDPGLATVKHPGEFFAQPSNDQMQVLAARMDLPSANAVAEGLNAYSGILSTLASLLGPAPRSAEQWVGFGRFDWQAAERHRFTLEGIGARWNSPGGGLTRVSETYGANSFGSSRASEQLLLARWEAFLSPNLLAVTQGSAGRTILNAQPASPSPFEQAFLSADNWGQLPQINVDSRYGFTIGNPSRFGAGSYPDERVRQIQENLDWVRGNLLVKSGFELSHNADATGLLRNQTGTYTYSSVENFASDALAFNKYGIAGQLQPADQHNCDETGKVWRDSGGGLRGLGNLPCYSYYSQGMGPSNWYLSTNDWAAFTTGQWQPAKLLVLSAGLRWQREQLPPPIATLNNADLPLTEKLPSLGDEWGPRVSLAFGIPENHWPVLRLAYGMYFGRTENATVETALTQTGSPNGDLSIFLRPTDNLSAGGAPPFPYVLSGEPGNIVKPGAVEFASRFRNPEIHQAVAAVEEELPGHMQLTANAMVSLGRRLPISIDTNFDPAVNPATITYAVVDGTGKGPIKTPQVTVPFYAAWPSSFCTGNLPSNLGGQCGWRNQSYQQLSEVMSRANSTYEAAELRITRYGPRGLSLHAHYTYSHAMDWNPNDSTTVAGSDVLDPNDFSQEYGTSDLDIRHSAALMAVMAAPWKLRGNAGRIANGWTSSVIGQFRSGLPYTMRTAGSLAEEFDQSTGAAIVALGPGMNGSGGDNRVYGVGRNTFRYPAAWKADLRVGKKFDLGGLRELELLVESFNLFNHQNVTQLETTGYYLESGTPSGGLPTLNFLTGLLPGTTAFGQPLNVNATNFYRERQIQVGARMRF